MKCGIWNAGCEINLKRGPLHPDSTFHAPNFSSGFTLIELIVVISLISIILVFSIPKFHGAVLTDHTKTVSRWIIGTIQSLKEKSVREQKLYILNIDIDANRLWVTEENMAEEELERAVQKGFEFPDDVNLLDVEYPGKGKVLFGETEIYFYKKGYADKALIHIEDNDYNQYTFLIEPFLSKTAIYERYVGFDE